MLDDLLEILESSKLGSKLLFICMTATILGSGNWPRPTTRTLNENVV